MRACLRFGIGRLFLSAALVTGFAACGNELPGGEPAKVSLGASVVVSNNGSDNIDVRVDYNAGARVDPSLAQLTAVNQRFPHAAMLATFDTTTGVTRSLYNPVGYLTTAKSTADPMAIAVSFARKSHDALGLVQGDLADFEVTDYVRSRTSGTTHVYLRQMHQGVPVYNGQLHVNIGPRGRVISVNNAFVPRIANAVGAVTPTITAADAVIAAARHLRVELNAPPRLLMLPTGARRATVLQADALSMRPVPAQLMWLSVRATDARLVWNLQVETSDNQHWYDLTLDAVTGDVWTRADWVASDQYRVYPVPVESPIHTAPAPPADARVLVDNPANATASPLAWHDTGSTSFTIMRGNNVHAYHDSDANNSPPASQPSCGAGLVCDFPLDLSSNPGAYTDAAVANLFYWNNIIHDVQYQYGFDEAGGNFQVNNFGNGGASGDDVRAEAQDGGGTNNANFSTPPDGSRPRMQMFLWNTTTPNRDGDLDDGIVIHEYGHGISIRQVGGPGNSSCLGNQQQPGEGWSDFFALVYTAEEGDAGTDARGIGTYALGQPATGDGIRSQRYSTDPSVNTHTYESIQGMAIPHGVGEVWAQAIWKVYWALVNTHGFSSDLHAASVGAGNHRALLYVNEGLKFTACSPTFTEARDGIIQAANANFSGEDVCLLWQTFAAYGLGTDAISGGSNSTSPTNGFAIPPECACSPQPAANAGADAVICLGGSAALGTSANPGTTYSWSPGGQTTAQITVSPTTTTTYTVTATTACGSATDSATVTVDDGTGDIVLYQTDFEDGASGWTHSAADSTCSTGTWGVGNPDGVTSSGVVTQVEDDHTVPGVNAWFTAPNTGGAGTNDVDGGMCTTLSPLVSIAAGATAEVSLWYYHGQRDAGDDPSGDFFHIDLSTDGGATYGTSLVSIGDVTSNAAWTQVQQTVVGPAQIALRVQASDGSGAGDLVEGGIDDVLITTTSACVPGCAPPEFDGVSEVTDNAEATCGLTVTWAPATSRCGADPSITYSVHRDTNPTFVPGNGNRIASCVTGTQYIDGDVAFGDTYYYVVRAEDANTGDAGPCNGGLIDENIVVANAGPSGGTAVLYETDFEAGASGWEHSAADSTCSTGTWGVGDPDGVTNGGVVTQLEDDHSVPGVNAWFTAPNTGGAGTNDVDGGVCTALSPVVDVAAGSTADVSLWYYHGQRDAGDDPSGDFFRIDLSTDSGATYGTSLVSIGDVTSDAAWTQVQTTVSGPAQIALRTQASDGAGPGDLVEGGIDDVRVTATAACTTVP